MLIANKIVHQLIIFCALGCMTALECKQSPKSSKNINRKERKKMEQRDKLYAKIAPGWFNTKLRAEYNNLLKTASVDQQLDWLRDQMEAKAELEQQRDALYAQLVETMTETRRYNYGQQPTLREQVDWLIKYERTMQGLGGGLQEYDNN